MNQKQKQWVVNAVFAGLLAVPVVLSSRSESGPKQSLGTEVAVSKYGFGLHEAAEPSGMSFRHQAPTLDPKIAHILPEIAVFGAAVSVVDYDRDGKEDLYVCTSGENQPNKLYRNLGNDKFQDVAAELGVADVNHLETGVSQGAIWGDVDNDGFEDLFLYRWGKPELFRNEGGKRFVPLAQAGLPDWVNANSATWLDYDRDGKLDLFLGGYYREDLNLWQLETTRIMPDSFEYAKNGGRKYLFRNLGDGKFQDVTAQVGLDSRRWALAAMAVDLQGTGYPDLVIANDYGVTEVWANEGGKRFQEVARSMGIAERPKSGMNVSLADVRNEGRFGIYISNITEGGQLIQGNNLWMPVAGSEGRGTRYVNEAGTLNVEDGGWSFGAQWGDLNNDGWQDLFCTNGYISAGQESYWYDFSKVALGSGGIIEDAKNWPPIGDRSHSGNQRKRVCLNKQGESFADVATEVGVTETFDGRAVALADFGNHGALDVAVAHQKGPLLFYRNRVDPNRSWVSFQLEGTRSNRSAIGAEVRLYWDGKVQLQQVSGGAGFSAQNSRRLHFGLGTAQQVEKVVIRWPSGQEQTLSGPEAGKLHLVKEPV